MNRIRLGNTVFEGLNNAYLFDGDGPTTLVDTGVATEETRDQLVEALADPGLAFADIDQILLTHWHADHAGLAGDIQAASGATVRVHRADATMVEQDPGAMSSMRDERDRLFEEWGIPEAPRKELVSFLDTGENISGNPPSVTRFEDGEQFRAGSETMTALHLPGHTSGLTGFIRESGESRELLSGDALLPQYTPNVGGADIRVENPLEQYLSTLALLIEEGFDRAWPGHRDPIPDPTGRASEILTHHRERTDRVVGTLRESGPADAWTVSAALFGDLENIHILHGPGEAYAHLEHLRDHGFVRHTSAGYELVDTARDVDSLFPTIEPV